MGQLKKLLKESGVPFKDDNMVQEVLSTGFGIDLSDPRNQGPMDEIIAKWRKEREQSSAKPGEFKDDFKDVQIGDVGMTYEGHEKWKVIRKGTVRELERFSPVTDTSALDPNQPAVLCQSVEDDDWEEKPILWVYGDDGFKAFKRQSQDRWFEEGMAEVIDPETQVINEGGQNDTLPAEKVNEVYKLLIESQNKLEEAARMLCNLHGVGAQIWRDLTKMDGMYEEPMSNLYRIIGE